MTESTINKVKFLASLATAYKSQDYFKKWKQEELLSDPVAALEFLFGHIFYQGRRDTLSEKFEKIAEAKIRRRYGDLTELSKAAPDFQEGSPFDLELKQAGLPKRMDRLMVLTTLELLVNMPNANIVGYSLSEIKNKRCFDLYVKLRDIKSVGDKVTSFYLRDLDFIFDLKEYLVADDYYLMQPIDTWVRQISVQIGLISPSIAKDDAIVKRRIIQGCLEVGVNPNDYNVGAWWCGAKQVPITV